MKNSVKQVMSILLWSVAANSLMAQDNRLTAIKSVYIVPSDMRGTVKQLEERIPGKLGWRVVHDPKTADALIGISESESITGYWVYEGPGTVSATTRVVGNVAYTNGTVTHGTRTVRTLKRRYGHVVVYDARTAVLLYNYTTRLWFIWSKLTGGFLKDMGEQLDRLRVVARESPGNTAAADEADQPDFDFSRYATLDELDGHAWAHLSESTKVGYLIGYIVAVSAVEGRLRSVFEDVTPSTAISPLLAASKMEHSNRQRTQSLIEQRALGVVEASQLEGTLQQILARLETFYEDSGNLPIPVVKAMVKIQDRELDRSGLSNRP